MSNNETTDSMYRTYSRNNRSSDPSNARGLAATPAALETRMAVSDGTCVRVATVSFALGVAVGFVLNTKIRRWLA